jgi:hypothetical protein
MRKLLVLFVAAALFGLTGAHQSAEAGHGRKAPVKTYICWGSVAGHTDCAWLPRGYRVPGVKRPTCCNVRGDSDRVDFVLTRRIIAALAAQGVRTDTMVPGAWAGLQAVCKKKH